MNVLSKFKTWVFTYFARTLKAIIIIVESLHTILQYCCFNSKYITFWLLYISILFQDLWDVSSDSDYCPQQAWCVCVCIEKLLQGYTKNNNVSDLFRFRTRHLVACQTLRLDLVPIPEEWVRNTLLFLG